MKKCLKGDGRDVVPGSNYCDQHQPGTRQTIKFISSDLSFADLSNTLHAMEQQDRIALVSLAQGEANIIEAEFRPVSSRGSIPVLRLFRASHDLHVSSIMAEHSEKEFVFETIVTLDGTDTRLLAFRELA